MKKLIKIFLLLSFIYILLQLSILLMNQEYQIEYTVKDQFYVTEKKIKKKEPIFNHELFFKVGDRVVCEYANDNYFVGGKHGKIIGFTQDEFLIEFDDNVRGHDGNGRCGSVSGRKGHCWYCDQRSIHHE